MEPGKILNIDAYPCYWPEGWVRTPSHRRKDSKYKFTFARARDEITRQLKLMGAREIVISTNIPLRLDGLPLANRSEPDDPAVAVYWAERGEWDVRAQRNTYKHRVIACDHWRRVYENMHAVNKSLDALRALQRAGATQVIEKAFTGFTALAASNPARGWREVFGLHPTRPVMRTEIDAMYRELAALRHPDRGGSHEQMTELNVAREQALRELAS